MWLLNRGIISLLERSHKGFLWLLQLKRFADEHVVIRDFFTVINRKWIWLRPQFKFLTRLHGILPSRYPAAPKDPKFKSNKPKLSTIMQDVSKLKFKVKNFAESRQKSYSCILSVGIISIQAPFSPFRSALAISPFLDPLYELLTLFLWFHRPMKENSEAMHMSNSPYPNSSIYNILSDFPREGFV